MSLLATQFGLRVLRRDNSRNYAAVLYANATTGLKVAVDLTELRPFLTIYELENGALLQEVPSVSTGTDRSKAFDVDDLLLVRPVDNSPVGKMFSGEDDQTVPRLLSEYMSALSSQASDVMSGNFDVFQRLDENVRARARSLKG
ncbi:MAG: hypothetical protein ABI700_33590 [Chloroflexota bacterium]